MLEKRWQEVVEIASATLSTVWPAVLHDPCESRSSEGVTFPLDDIAGSLAKAYSNIDQDVAARHIYLQFCGLQLIAAVKILSSL